MSDNLSQDPSLFGSIGQSLSDQAALLGGDPLLDLLPSLHEGMGGSSFAVDIASDGLRVYETGLEAWLQYLREQRAAKDAARIDDVTGYAPVVSSPTHTSSHESFEARDSDASVLSEASSSLVGNDRASESAEFGLEMPEVIRLEAESLERSGGYVSEQQASASGEGLIRINKRQGDFGSISTTFEGVSGTYAVIVGHYDEADGTGMMALDVGAERFSWELDDNLKGGRKANHKTFVRRVVSPAMDIETGMQLELSGLRDRGELAAVDYIELVPVDPRVPLPFRVEAEDTNLSYFKSSPSVSSSSGRVITLQSKKNGRAQFSFPRETGLYNVVVGYASDPTGAVKYSLQVSGEQYHWLGNSLTTVEPQESNLSIEML